MTAMRFLESCIITRKHNFSPGLSRAAPLRALGTATEAQPQAQRTGLALSTEPSTVNARHHVLQYHERTMSVRR